MTLTKVEDGLSLSKMLLCQICGIRLDSPICLADEDLDNLSVNPLKAQFEMKTAYDNRPELKSLELATKIYDEKINIARADYLPQISFVGNYLVTNPSIYNGFEKKFKGMWSVGVTLKVPVWNWGEGTNKIRQAKAEANISRYQLSDAREKIELQVNQSAYKVNEALKRYTMAKKNMEKAEENLRYANVGFKEGVIPASNVLEAHTACIVLIVDERPSSPKSIVCLPDTVSTSNPASFNALAYRVGIIYDENFEVFLLFFVISSRKLPCKLPIVRSASCKTGAASLNHSSVVVGDA